MGKGIFVRNTGSERVIFLSHKKGFAKLLERFCITLSNISLNLGSSFNWWVKDVAQAFLKSFFREMMPSMFQATSLSLNFSGRMDTIFSGLTDLWSFQTSYKSLGRVL